MKLAFSPVQGPVGYWRCLSAAYWLDQMQEEVKAEGQEPRLEKVHHVKVLDKNVGGLSHEEQREAVREADVILTVSPAGSFDKHPEFRERRGALCVDVDDDVKSWVEDPAAAHDELRDQHPDKIRCLQEWIANADLVTTTTPYLAERLKESYGAREVAVCPNCVSPEMQRKAPRSQDAPVSLALLQATSGKLPKNRRPTKRVAHVGTITHQPDLGPMLAALRRVALVEPELTVLSLGPMNFLKEPEWLGMQCPRDVKYGRAAARTQNEAGEIVTSNVVPFGVFFDTLEGMAPDVAVVPLRPSPFNMSKSLVTPISWAVQGVPCVMSRVGPYAEAEKEGLPGHYVDHESVTEWFDAVRELLRTPRLARELGEEAKAWVADHYAFPAGVMYWHRAFERACEIRRKSCPTFAATAAPKPSSQCPPPEEGASERCA